MGGMIPLGDASRRPAHMPVVTALVILANAFVFVLELMRGEAFLTQWSGIPAQIVSGHHSITIFTAMFMHGSWSHIIGNMIFLWAFSPEIEDAMGAGRTSCFSTDVNATSKRHSHSPSREARHGEPRQRRALTSLRRSNR